MSGKPDFLLTLWDWKTGDVLLRSKAFSQEIYTLKFSYIDDHKLITSGTGHIKFWTIADTFTGMKLQGFLGKFGKVPLMDVPDFIELDHDFVLSGTETGDLLLWKDGLIKVILHRL